MCNLRIFFALASNIFDTLQRIAESPEYLFTTLALTLSARSTWYCMCRSREGRDRHLSLIVINRAQGERKTDADLASHPPSPFPLRSPRGTIDITLLTFFTLPCWQLCRPFETLMYWVQLAFLRARGSPRELRRLNTGTPPVSSALLSCALLCPVLLCSALHCTALTYSTLPNPTPSNPTLGWTFWQGFFAAQLMVVFAIGMVFSTSAPVVLFFCLLYVAMNSLIFKFRFVFSFDWVSSVFGPVCACVCSSLRTSS